MVRLAIIFVFIKELEPLTSRLRANDTKLFTIRLVTTKMKSMKGAWFGTSEHVAFCSKFPVHTTSKSQILKPIPRITFIGSRFIPNFLFDYTMTFSFGTLWSFPQTNCDSHKSCVVSTLILNDPFLFQISALTQYWSFALNNPLHLQWRVKFTIENKIRNQGSFSLGIYNPALLFDKKWQERSRYTWRYNKASTQTTYNLYF